MRDASQDAEREVERAAESVAGCARRCGARRDTEREAERPDPTGVAIPAIAHAAPRRSTPEAAAHARRSSRRRYQATRVPEAANEATTPDARPWGGSRSAGSGRRRALVKASRRSGDRRRQPTAMMPHAISAKTQATMWAR
jgi:hypothetical protein